MWKNVKKRRYVDNWRLPHPPVRRGNTDSWQIRRLHVTISTNEEVGGRARILGLSGGPVRFFALGSTSKQAGRPAHYRPTNWQLGGVAIFPKLIVEIGIQTLKQSSIVRP